MGILSAVPLIGGVVEKVFGLVDQAIEDKDKAREFKQAIEMQVLQGDLRIIWLSQQL